MAITSTPIFINSKKKPSKSNPDTEPMFDAIAPSRLFKRIAEQIERSILDGHYQTERMR